MPSFVSRTLAISWLVDALCCNFENFDGMRTVYGLQLGFLIAEDLEACHAACCAAQECTEISFHKISGICATYVSVDESEVDEAYISGSKVPGTPSPTPLPTAAPSFYPTELPDSDRLAALEIIVAELQTLVTDLQECSCPPGQEGPPGEQGVMGDEGPQGERGPPGIQGTSGEKGTPGLSTFGAPGLAGIHGAPGATGTPGIPGEDGIPGCDGAPGEAGVPGSDGVPGPHGPPGPPGEDGAPWMPPSPPPSPPPTVSPTAHPTAQPTVDPCELETACTCHTRCPEWGWSSSADKCKFPGETTSASEWDDHDCQPDCSNTPCSRLSCTDQGLSDQDPVCAYTGSASLGNCSGKKTHQEAVQFCDSNYGFRLCSVCELEQNVAIGTGCYYNDERVWSSTRCGTFGLYTTGGAAGIVSTQCQEDNQNHYVRCCADSSLLC